MTIRHLLTALAALGAASTASAQDMRLEAKAMQPRTTIEDGKPVTTLVPAGKVTPGDEVHYVLAYTNAGARAAGDVVLVNPVPADLEYVAADNGALVSVDGGKVFAPLASLAVTAADGTSRPATGRDVTHVRWNLPPVAAGAKGQVSFQARLK